MKTFEVQFRYRDRNEESIQSAVKVEASSLALVGGSICQGLIASRFDMKKEDSKYREPVATTMGRQKNRGSRRELRVNGLDSQSVGLVSSRRFV
jgi:hypothetical protein